MSGYVYRSVAEVNKDLIAEASTFANGSIFESYEDDADETPKIAYDKLATDVAKMVTGRVGTNYSDHAVTDAIKKYVIANDLEFGGEEYEHAKDAVWTELELLDDSDDDRISKVPLRRVN